MEHRVLVVEDDSVADELQARMCAEGHETTRVTTGVEAFYLVNTQRFDLLILGLSSRVALGPDYVASLRAVNKEILILCLLCQVGVEDRVSRLRAGADDCLVAPYSIDELLVRAEVLLRRGRLGQMLRLAVSDLIMDLGVRRVTRAGHSIPLTTREFEVLETLMRRAHQANLRA